MSRAHGAYLPANPEHEPDPRYEGGPSAFALGQLDYPGSDYMIGSSHQGSHRLQQLPPQSNQQLDNNNNTNQINNAEKPKKFRLKLSERLHWTAVLAFISYLVLIVSFASPYWLSSYKFADSAFKRLGLWDFCFKDYRHPAYQYDHKFTGCRWIYSPDYANIRDWLQPGWFIFVQTTMTLALCAQTVALTATSIIFMHFLIKYQLIIMCIILVCHLFTTMLVGFAIVIFYFKAFDRAWIMYPEFNHVDWAFFFALVAMASNGFASCLYYKEIQLLKQRLMKLKRIVSRASTTNGRSPGSNLGAAPPSPGGNLPGGDLDSLDAVYASRSAYGALPAARRNKDGAQAPAPAPTGFGYPHFTQV